MSGRKISELPPINRFKTIEEYCADKELNNKHIHLCYRLYGYVDLFQAA